MNPFEIDEKTEELEAASSSSENVLWHLKKGLAYYLAVVDSQLEACFPFFFMFCDPFSKEMRIFRKSISAPRTQKVHS